MWVVVTEFVAKGAGSTRMSTPITRLFVVSRSQAADRFPEPDRLVRSGPWWRSDVRPRFAVTVSVKALVDAPKSQKWRSIMTTAGTTAVVMITLFPAYLGAEP